MIVLHLSDIHFGKPHRPEVLQAALDLLEAVQPSAVVVSGDLTQRAKPRECRAARHFVASLAPFPVAVIPGNHDVPLYRVWERLLAPYRNYRRHIGYPLDLVLDVPNKDKAGIAGTRFVALNSTSPRAAIVNGRLSSRQFRFAGRSFRASPPGWCRVLALHHNLLAPADGESGPPPLRGAARVLERLEDWGVDMVLSGHIHRAWTGLYPVPDTGAGSGFRVPLVHAGTTSSNRGRGTERGRNSLCAVRVEECSVEVVPYLYSDRAGCFRRGESSRYPRRT